jgi:hypothetical protein
MRIQDPGWRQFGSGIRDGKKSDPGPGINIPDPQHWSKYSLRNTKEKGIVGNLFISLVVSDGCVI